MFVPYQCPCAQIDFEGFGPGGFLRQVAAITGNADLLCQFALGSARDGKVVGAMSEAKCSAPCFVAVG
jgi:hypothetical protein